MPKLNQAYYDAAVAAEKKYGPAASASLSLAQFIFESGGGRDMPGGTNNPFGIKASPGEPGHWAKTQEYNQKTHQFYTTQAYFRDFKSIGDAFDYHGRMLATSPLYAEARKKLPDVDAYIRSLGPTYASDPAYADKLLRTTHAIAHNPAAYVDFTGAQGSASPGAPHAAAPGGKSTTGAPRSMQDLPDPADPGAAPDPNAAPALASDDGPAQDFAGSAPAIGDMLSSTTDGAALAPLQPDHTVTADDIGNLGYDNAYALASLLGSQSAAQSEPPEMKPLAQALSDYASSLNDGG